MASSSSRAHETHVLLVEHDSKDHDAIGDLLHYFSYKVTSVKLASTAISILSKGKSQFDMVLANLNSPDFYGPQLLQEAAKMDLLVFCEYSSMLSVMTDDDNVVTSMSAIEQGAILCMRKTMMMQMIGYLWQYVLRERTMRSKQREKLMMMMEFRNGLFGDEDCTSDDMNNEDGEARKSNEKAKGVKIGGKDDNSRDKQDRHDGTTTVAYKRKIWTEWTLELHEKFVNAVLQLGEGNCYPKEILELMNVPGLTRMQVASHLQRCRHGKWLPPHLRKFKPTTAEPKPPKAKIPRAKQTRFGCMPHVDQFTLSIQEYQKQLWNNQEHTTNPTSTENTAGQLTLGEDGSFPIEPCYFGTPNVAPIANISSNQSDRNGDQNAFQFPSVDEIDRHFASLQQELGMDYNGSWLQALLLDTDYHSQIANVTDANNKKEMPEPGNDDEETER